MPRSIASAPGKTMLFGEHAALYGVTAVAAALSDLRVVVEADTISEPHIEISLPDLLCDSPEPEKKEDHVFVVTHDMLKECLPMKPNPLHAEVPTKEIIMVLKSACFDFPVAVASTAAAACYLAAYIAPECIWGAREDNMDPRRGLRITVNFGELPVGVGLGSSAAFSVATAAALLRLRQLMFGDLLGDGAADPTLDDLMGDVTAGAWVPPDSVLHIINEWAFASEVIIHGDPSGLDNTTSCFGGTVRLNRNEGRFETLKALPNNLRVLLTNTKIDRPARDIEAKIRSFYDDHPLIARPILEAVEAVSQEFLHALDELPIECSDYEGSIDYTSKVNAFVRKMSALCASNHSLLYCFGVGHPAVLSVCDAGTRVGMASKMTGAGGCCITILPPHDRAVLPVSCYPQTTLLSSHTPYVSANVSHVQESIRLFRETLSSMKYEHFLSCLGGGGVLWHNESPDCYSKRTTSTMADMARPVDSIAEPAVPTPKRTSVLSMSVFALDLSIATAAILALYRIDQTFDPEGMLSPDDSALLAFACFAFGLSMRGIIGLILVWVFTQTSGFL